MHVTIEHSEQRADNQLATQIIDPSILYLGTPVMLLSTLNLDGSTNLAPTSSGWWLDKTGVLGVGNRAHTIANLKRTPEIVVNMCGEELAAAVDRLAATTGIDPVPEYKQAMGFTHVANTFQRAGLTPTSSEQVAPLRVAECAFQIECRVDEVRDVGPDCEHNALVQVRAIRTHVHASILKPGQRHHIDPDRWRPLIMNFLEFCGLRAARTRDSYLAEVFN